MASKIFTLKLEDKKLELIVNEQACLYNFDDDKNKHEIKFDELSDPFKNNFDHIYKYFNNEANAGNLKKS